MTLKEKIQEDFKASMRNKEQTKKSVLTMLRAAMKQREVDERIELDDADIFQIIVKQVKQKENAIQEFEKCQRIDLVEATQKEIAILKEYLPEPMTEAEIGHVVESAIKEIGATSIKDMGKVMAKITSKIQGRADTAKVSQKVKQILNNNKA